LRYLTIEKKWKVEFDDDFKAEFDGFPEEVRLAILEVARVLQGASPGLGRPRVDTLNGSKHANMKELRCDADDGVWRVAFGTERKALLLTAGDKSGVNQKRFYKKLNTRPQMRVSMRTSRD
jgi:hypothetical protein